MAGLFPGICNTQNLDRNGKPLKGSVLTVYLGGTLTIADCFQDIGLAIPAQNPMTADITGRLPIFYVADGTYRIRYTDETGVAIFDFPQVPSIGASSSGGGGAAVDPTTIFQTGDPIWVPIQGSRAGYVRLAGRTIGSATSGASERANADCQNLFLYNWNTYPDTVCPVLTGRGANAAADWAANKRLTLLDMRNKGPFGLADMGNATTAEFDGITFIRGDKNTAAALLGAAKKTLLLSEVPPHDHGGVTGPTTPTPTTFNVTNVQGFGTILKHAFSPDNADGGASTTGQVIPPHLHTIASAGGGAAFDKMSPGMLGTWYQKL